MVANLDPQCAMPIAACQLIITALSSTLRKFWQLAPDRTRYKAAARMELPWPRKKAQSRISEALQNSDRSFRCGGRRSLRHTKKNAEAPGCRSGHRCERFVAIFADGSRGCGNADSS